MNKAASGLNFSLSGQYTVGDAPHSYTLTTNPSNSGAVTFTSNSPSVCTIASDGAGGVVVVAAGTCSITANQAAGANYLAGSVTARAEVNKRTQTITFAQPADHTYGDAPFSISATSDSMLTVTFTSNTPSVCTVAGTQVAILTAGTCSIVASQGGNATYQLASVTRTFEVNKAVQTINFGALSSHPFGAAPFNLGATATSGLAVGFTSLTLPVCTASGVQVTLLSPGMCSIQASQQGNPNYLAAATVTQSFSVIPGDITISGSHSGNFSQGQMGAVYTITVSNAGPGSTYGVVTVTDALPASGLQAVSIGGTGWSCTLATLICSRADALPTGQSYPAITLVVNVGAAAPPSVVNQASVAGGADTNLANETANDPTTIVAIVIVSNSISVTQSGFARNRTTGHWTATLTATNTSTGLVNGPIQVVLTDLTPGVTMVNNTGTRNGSPYITVSPGPLAPGASANVVIQFNNPSNGFITFTPVSVVGVF